MNSAKTAPMTPPRSAMAWDHFIAEVALVGRGPSARQFAVAGVDGTLPVVQKLPEDQVRGVG